MFAWRSTDGDTQQKRNDRVREREHVRAVTFISPFNTNRFPDPYIASETTLSIGNVENIQNFTSRQSSEQRSTKTYRVSSQYSYCVCVYVKCWSSNIHLLILEHQNRYTTSNARFRHHFILYVTPRTDVRFCSSVQYGR